MSLASTYLRLKPHILMVVAQIGYTFLYIIVEASFNHGMDPYVYVTYRHIVAALLMLPFAYFIERFYPIGLDTYIIGWKIGYSFIGYLMRRYSTWNLKKPDPNTPLQVYIQIHAVIISLRNFFCRKTRPKLTLALFMEIFVLSLLGVSLTLNMFFKSMKYTSPTFLACMVNTIASLTFIIAVTLRMEIVNVGSLRGIAKILGTVVSLAGVMTITLYKGPALKNIGYSHIQMKGSTIAAHENWLKGSILTVASCITWSILYIMQAYTLKRYPAPLSLTTWMNLVGAAQSAIFTAIVQHKQAAWTIGFNIDLWSILYSGVVISGMVTYIQLWCTEAKGPVFVTMFNPLSTFLVAVLAYFVLGEKLHVGSIIGGVVVIMGLYLLLWGKEEDEAQTKLKETKDSKIMIFSSNENYLRGEP